MVVYHWRLSIQVRFIGGQLDGHNAVPEKAGEAKITDAPKTELAPSGKAL